MANENLEKKSLRSISLFTNGDRLNQENLNRPIIALRDNAIEQKTALDKVIDLLDSGDTSLDDLSEVATFIQSNKEELRDITNAMKGQNKQRLDRMLEQTDILDITYLDNGSLDSVFYDWIPFYNAETNINEMRKYEQKHSYDDDLLVETLYIKIENISLTEIHKGSEDKISVEQTITDKIITVTNEDEYTGSTSTSENIITLENEDNDGLDCRVVYTYEDGDGEVLDMEETLVVKGKDIECMETIKELKNVYIITYEEKTVPAVDRIALKEFLYTGTKDTDADKIILENEDNNTRLANVTYTYKDEEENEVTITEVLSIVGKEIGTRGEVTNVGDIYIKKDVLYTGSITVNDKEITLDNTDYDGLDVECIYSYIKRTSDTKNTMTYSGSDVKTIKWEVL